MPAPIDGSRSNASPAADAPRGPDTTSRSPDLAPDRSTGRTPSPARPQMATDRLSTGDADTSPPTTDIECSSARASMARYI